MWGMAGRWSSQNIHIYQLSALLYGCGSWHPKTITIVMSNITLTNIRIMRKFEILQELRKYDRRKRKCWNMMLTDLLNAGLPQTFGLLKNAVLVKHKKARFACTYIKQISLFFFSSSLIT